MYQEMRLSGPKPPPGNPNDGCFTSRSPCPLPRSTIAGKVVQRVGRATREVSASRVVRAVRQCAIGVAVVHRRAVGQESRETSALKVVVANAVPEDVAAPDFTAVVLELMVRLRRSLRGEETLSRAERNGRIAEAKRIGADGEFEGGGWIERSRGHGSRWRCD